MEKLLKLRDILVHTNDYSWDDSLFLPEDKHWTLNSPCAVLNMDDLEDDEDVPQFAATNKLIYVLGIQDVQDIANNAREQNPNCSAKNLFNAFLYYYKHDAFIVL
jgi:hypothetical protein